MVEPNTALLGSLIQLQDGPKLRQGYTRRDNDHTQTSNNPTSSEAESLITPPKIDAYLPKADLIVLDNLFEDVRRDRNNGPAATHSSLENVAHLASKAELDHDKSALNKLKAMNDASHPDFQPTVFVTWDDKDIHPLVNKHLVHPYARLAQNVVRHPADVVFLTHIILYMTVNLGSAAFLFYHFTWLHGIAHVLYTLWCTGSFTLMMHNHIHNNGVLAKNWAWLDTTFPYVLEPLMGHTWDSYYYHHVKHHHVEGNGPDDLSSTIRYQRDDLFNFLHYLGRFLFFVWAELPLYFYRKGKSNLAVRALCSELASYALIYTMYHLHPKAATFAFIIPFVQLRLGLMIGNWGQHALVDELEPDSDFRSSITLIDVPSNRFCFNDGYHTAHHLNPRRHWREQPVHFLQQKGAYKEGRALVFHNIDYLMMTVSLLRKNYMHLAKCMVPIGQEQVNMTLEERAAMLRTKTRKFTEEDIQRKFK
ncbi:hypothetical protein EJ03DRAFT_155307 [Teratosphaeria nubilosa]|uniref:Fatty acid desaturase domain-containing protein n=1 Tax=Teratosphaeria nubilosa TaxID=161662 RepID=A0A6G1LKM3_9PEZI|nr:hypothetical protein EJ03DRAFT_155307 [Teratosphaeria nubilosa]